MDEGVTQATVWCEFNYAPKLRQYCTVARVAVCTVQLLVCAWTDWTDAEGRSSSKLTSILCSCHFGPSPVASCMSSKHPSIHVQFLTSGIWAHKKGHPSHIGALTHSPFSTRTFKAAPRHIFQSYHSLLPLLRACFHLNASGGAQTHGWSPAWKL